jgi:hypothetical protein
MAKTAIGRAAWVLLAIAAGGAGYAAGQRQVHQAAIAMMHAEAAGNLTQRIEALSLLRMAEVPAAIDRLESEADQLTRTIAVNSGADKRALAFVKTYLSVAPPSPSRAEELSAILEDVPVLEPGECSSALKALLLSARGEAAGQHK